MMVTAGLLSFAVTSSAQRDSILFEENHTIDTTAIGELRVNIDNLNFFKNNEYESQITKGYTLPGFWVKPSVSYQPLRNLKVDVGAYMILGFYKIFYEYLNWEEFLQMVWLVNNHMFFEYNSQNEEQKRNKESLWGSELYQNLLSLHEANKKCQRRG